jgi:hypothetical protein
MKDWRKTKLLSGLLFLSSAASAQSLDELVGSNLTLEESLVQFVNSLTSFQVGGAEEVLLYVVTPLIGFYYLILNFVTMAYENFQDEVDRPAWRNTDDSIPTGMRGFAMITSVITVLFLGTAGAGVLLVTGLISLTLALLMFLGLFENENQGGNQQAPQQQQQQQQTPQQNQQPQNQTTWADALNAAANLFGTANNAAQNFQQWGQQQVDNEVQESLRFFQNDVVAEMDRVRSKRTDIESMIGQANNELTDPNDFRPEAFKNLLQRAKAIDSLLEDIRSEMVKDFNTDPNPNYTGSDLAIFLYNNNVSSGGDRNPLKEIKGLEGQIDRILSSGSASPPDDIFNDLLEELQYVVAVGHFIHYSPFSMSEIAGDDAKAQKVVTEAQNMNKINSRPDNVTQIKNLAGWADTRRSVASNLISEAEKLCKKEMKINQSEIEALKSVIGEDEDIHNKLKYIERNLNDYRNVRGFKSDMQAAENKMKNIDDKLASLESKLSSSTEYEADIYKKLKELEGKI